MKVPVATYRLQLNPGFTFYQAAEVVPYLRRLGVSHLYLSPVMAATAGSTHGYDVTDHGRLNPELGGDAGFDALMRALDDDMQVVLDIVPNHMAASLENPWWRDVLENGEASRYWRYFDLFPGSDGRIALPVLEDHADALIDKGVIFIEERDGESVLRYHDHAFPLRRDRVQRGDDVRAILREQHYALLKWDAEAFTYRRFFHLASLVGLRMEDEAVMRDAHGKLFDLLGRYPQITGLRVDHIDGLAMPEKYLSALRGTGRDIWVEKILARGEALPAWPVAGTTGYEFIDGLNNLVVDRAGFAELEAWWRQTLEPAWPDFSTCLYRSKHEALAELFAGQVKWLADHWPQPHAGGPMPAAIHALTAAMPVYRIYGDGAPDLAAIKAALETLSRCETPETRATAENLLPVLLTPQNATERTVAHAWRQLSGAAMAKGLEDRAHYRYTPLAALNEVGCTPEMSVFPQEAFCAFLQARLRQPLCLNATSTHDTKRSEDARARLYALADMPDEWKAYAGACLETAAPFLQGISAAVFHFFLQAVVATWPGKASCDDAYRRRLSAYMEKAALEESRHTRHESRNEVYHRQLDHLVGSFLADAACLEQTDEFMKHLAPAAAVNALSVLTVKCLSPGVPDIYQGCEVWDHSLVDPDNRRPVDFGALADLQRRVEVQPPAALLPDWKNGGIKLWLTRRLLEIRRAHLTDGILSVEPVVLRGPCAAHVNACTLATRGAALMILHPLHPGKIGLRKDLGLPDDVLAGIETVPAPERAGAVWQDLINGGQYAEKDIPLALKAFPVAVLLRQAEPGT
jgi:(1->4)-alpha-D-glucan 1-alpha-D-glucosylmutase